MSTCSWRIVQFDFSHIAEAGDMHQVAFPGFFLSFLGRRFLRELYRAFALEKDCIALAAEDSLSGVLIGVAVGTLKPNRFFRRLLFKRWWAFCLWSLPALVKEPRSLIRLLRATVYRGDSPQDKERALVSSIAVAPEKQGTGLGSVLLREWVETALKSGARGCYLTTDAVGNDSVNQFYIRNGWRVESEFVTPESRKMYRYIFDWE